jgi:signal transduction histidine kinase
MTHSEEAQTTPAILPQLLKPTLLVVDDEEGPRTSLRVVFKDDYNVLLAGDGVSGIELAKKHPVDVAVLDIRMGGMSGIELLERLKEADPAVEVVMMTAFETADTIRQALRLRACDYINKPFDLNTMRDAVARAMKRRSFSAEVRDNAEKLQALQTELQQLKLEEEIVRTRGEIYASIIHDINSPLTVISGQIQVINQRIGDKKRIDGAELDEIKDRLKRITRQVTACIEISRRYLGFLRRSAAEASRVAINQILADLKDLLRAHPQVRNNELVIEPLPEDATVSVNGTDLIQILLNLTINALQCAPHAHRVEIRGQCLRQPLDLNTFEDSPNDRFLNRDGFNSSAPLMALSVRDNGPGIPANVLPKLFQTYFTTHPHDGGTGLGLCIVHRLIKESQGGLHVHSKPGQGTTFTIYLPARLGSSTDTTLTFA